MSANCHWSFYLTCSNLRNWWCQILWSPKQIWRGGNVRWQMKRWQIWRGGNVRWQIWRDLKRWQCIQVCNKMLHMLLLFLLLLWRILQLRTAIISSFSCCQIRRSILCFRWSTHLHLLQIFGFPPRWIPFLRTELSDRMSLIKVHVSLHFAIFFYFFFGFGEYLFWEFEAYNRCLNLEQSLDKKYIWS